MNLKKFLMMASFLPNDNLVLAIIRRCDIDGDAQLNFMEFSDALRPMPQAAPQKKIDTRANKENYDHVKPWKPSSFTQQRPKSAHASKQWGA